jgi:deoxyribodipyrimidine photo-lyase
MAQPVIMWFRQDLRLSDHPALAAAAAAGPVIPVFILDDESAGAWPWGGASRWWLHHSLERLGGQVPLVLARGRSDAVLATLLRETGAAGVYFTRDYAPWSAAVEQRVKAVCEQAGASCHRYGGFLLHEPDTIRTGAGGYFKVYTPFSRACLSKGEPRATRPAVQVTWASHRITRPALGSFALLPTRPNWATGFEPVWQPGEAGAWARLLRFLDDGLKGYAEGRDRADLAHTSRLSPHLHWGEISPHQVWQAARQAMAAAHGSLDHDGEKFLKEVLWREFAYHLIHHVPGFPEQPFRPEFAGFPWAPDASAQECWQRGETGYPIVDAGMRELWATGIMHNRVRMIVASFFIKHLLQPWQDGERWFWDTLVDADIGNNAASWQWVAGCGADASPYFRIFNPVLQGEKFDPHGTYVKRWVPELHDVPADVIHRPWEMTTPPKAYPPPMIEHSGARARALAAFAALKTGENP